MIINFLKSKVGDDACKISGRTPGTTNTVGIRLPVGNVVDVLDEEIMSCLNSGTVIGATEFKFLCENTLRVSLGINRVVNILKNFRIAIQTKLGGKNFLGYEVVVDDGDNRQKIFAVDLVSKIYNAETCEISSENITFLDDLSKNLSKIQYITGSEIKTLLEIINGVKARRFLLSPHPNKIIDRPGVDWFDPLSADSFITEIVALFYKDAINIYSEIREETMCYINHSDDQKGGYARVSKNTLDDYTYDIEFINSEQKEATKIINLREMYYEVCAKEAPAGISAAIDGHVTTIATGKEGGLLGPKAIASYGFDVAGNFKNLKKFNLAPSSRNYLKYKTLRPQDGDCPAYWYQSNHYKIGSRIEFDINGASNTRDTFCFAHRWRSIYGGYIRFSSSYDKIKDGDTYLQKALKTGSPPVWDQTDYHFCLANVVVDYKYRLGCNYASSGSFWNGKWPPDSYQNFRSHFLKLDIIDFTTGLSEDIKMRKRQFVEMTERYAILEQMSYWESAEKKFKISGIYNDTLDPVSNQTLAGICFKDGDVDFTDVFTARKIERLLTWVVDTYGNFDWESLPTI